MTSRLTFDLVFAATTWDWSTRRCVTSGLGNPGDPVKGTPRLSGPELEAHAPDNSLELVWVRPEELDELGLHPEHLRRDLALLLGP